jgi:hypothetical protein
MKETLDSERGREEVVLPLPKEEDVKEFTVKQIFFVEGSPVSCVSGRGYFRG